MAQFFKLGFTTLLLFIGFTSSLPIHKLEKRSSATYLGDLASEEFGILNDDQGMELYTIIHIITATFNIL